MERFRQYLETLIPLSSSQWETIQSYFEVRPFQREQFFLRQGQICRRAAFIAEGIMRYCSIGEDGTEITCYFIAENGFILDPDSFSTQKPSALTIQAVTDCLLITLTYEGSLKLAQAFPQWEAVSGVIAQKSMMELVNQRSFLLNRNAESKYLHFIEHYPHILQRAPLGYIASYLGITQQSLSRLRKHIA